MPRRPPQDERVPQHTMYTAFGLTFTSEVELPGASMVSADSVPDAVIRFGDVPEELAEAAARFENADVRQDCVLIRTEAGRFLAKDGREIIVAPDDSATPDNLRLYILGSAFGALLQQRGRLPLHANLVMVNGRCIAISGAAGAGKSTLSMAMMQRGHHLISDDVCAAELQEGKSPVVWGGFRRVKLWEETLASLGVSKENAAELRQYRSRKKYAIALDGDGPSGCFALHTLLLLSEPEADRNIRLTDVNGSDRLAAVLANTYRQEFLPANGMLQPMFDVAAALEKKIRILRLIRRKDLSQMDQVMDLIEQSLADDWKQS